ncbi:MAG TPA: chromate resistance protein ChrB domain-containing protein [Terriglobia bacterium]|nr:chromate resistance protein ChrB domain-containing protein [Terriglobia bacterium]
MKTSEPTTWLMLIHQVPNSPAYLRVKMWRRLQKIGAVAVKNAVYVLPRSDQALEDFHWIAREIIEGGGEASVCEATFVEGITTSDLVALFQQSRKADYADLGQQIQDVAREQQTAENAGDPWASGMAARVSRLRQRLTEIQVIDFYPSPAGKQAEAVINELESRIRQAPLRKGQQSGSYSGRTWVTRTGVHVDRIASAWLIRRFIDTQARFKFVAAKGYRPEERELRFDMFDAEFTHEGNLCTFEALTERMGITDRALRRLGEIIHDIDLKESRFSHPETPGLALVVNAICSRYKDDPGRIERATIVLDDLYEYFKKR